MLHNNEKLLEKTSIVLYTSIKIFENMFFFTFQVVDYEGNNHIRNPEMRKVLLTHEIICR